MDTLKRPQDAVSHYTYRVAWSPEDDGFVATVAEFPSLSWLAPSQFAALEGPQDLLTDAPDAAQPGGMSSTARRAPSRPWI